MFTIGFDIGGTKCVATFGRQVGGKLHILKKGKMIMTQAYLPAEVIEMLCEDAKIFMDSMGSENILGIGISCGGPLSSEHGIILSPPNLPGWDAVPICQMVEASTGLKSWLMNDANACALAEWKFGAGVGCHHMAFLTFGTGLGSGLILNNQLYQGKNDMAGEIGHIRLSQEGPVGYGKIGSFEGFCSGGGIQQLAYNMILEAQQNGKITMLDLKHTTAKDVGEAASQGDDIAKLILKKTGIYLGKGLSILIDVLNLEKIIIGGIYMRCENFIQPSLQEVINQEVCLASQDCLIEPSQLGESIGDYAAISIPFYMRSKYEETTNIRTI